MSNYRKITTVQVVLEEDAEAVIEQMNAAMDKIGELQTIYDSSLKDEDAPKPANAAEIGKAV
jgi:hypothetical protein